MNLETYRILSIEERDEFRYLESNIMKYFGITFICTIHILLILILVFLEIVFFNYIPLIPVVLSICIFIIAIITYIIGIIHIKKLIKWNKKQNISFWEL